MRKKALIGVLVLVVLLCACAFAACNDDGGGNGGNETPTVTVTIADKSVTEVYVGRTLQLAADKDPATTEVTWESSDTGVATVSADGLVTGVAAGKATISVKVGEETKDSLDITVKETIIDTSVNSDKFDMTGLYQDDAVLVGSQNSFAVFRGDASQYYVASATVKVTEPDGNDTWSRVGVSHYNGEKYYGLMLSPGPDFNARKTVTMVIDAEGNVEWGTVTDRSQVWNHHDLSAIDFNEVTLTAVRAGNEFYAFINGELYYYENGLDGFTDVDTVPVLNVGGSTAEFSAMQVTYGQEGVEEYLATADDAMFYPTSSSLVILGEDGSIKFTGASDGTAPTNPKDHAAKSIGIKAVLPADEEGSVSFDLTIDSEPANRNAAIAVTMNRYDGAYAEARSLVVGQYQAGWTGWNTNGDMPSGIGVPHDYQLNDEAARLEVGETYHVTVTRLMTETGQDNALTVADSEGNILFEGTWGWNNDGYTGRVSVSFLCREMDCTISNIVFA